MHHIAAHGVTRSQVEAALQGRLYRRRSGNAMRVIGIAEGRCLFIVLRRSRVRPGCAEVATARPASRSEKRLFATRGKGT